MGDWRSSDPLIDESVALEACDRIYTNVPVNTLLEISGAYEATLPFVEALSRSGEFIEVKMLPREPKPAM